jgi:glycosyltransferase involved in cell wall biosynthesis
MINFKISIITINYNNLSGLIKTFSSIANQIVKPDIYEWIVIDGNSTDGSRKWLLDTQAVFKYTYISESDNGIYNAMNKGIRMSNGKYILFLNSGDIFYKNNSLEYLNNTISNNKNSDLFLFGFKYNNIKRNPKPLWWRYWSLPTSHQSILYKQDLLISNQFNENYSFASDYDHFLKLLNKDLHILRDNFILIENEKYGSDKNFYKLKIEYKSIFLKNYPNKYLAIFLVELKFTYYNILKYFN